MLWIRVSVILLSRLIEFYPEKRRQQHEVIMSWSENGWLRLDWDWTDIR